MATNKNQHFVPRCYLRPFTPPTNSSTINLFNIDRERLITGAPLKNQCSRNYFYGKDEKLESAIQAMEQGYASTLKRVTTNNYSLTEKDSQRLKYFWLFQYLRTEESSKRHVSMANDLTQKAQLEQEVPPFKMSDAVRTSMKVFAQNMDIVSDLKGCLIRNRSKTPFITSDDPAILTNRWNFLNLQRAGRSIGLIDSGVILILPMTPEICFFAFDGDVYSIPNKKGWITIKKDSDADAINQHQYLNCKANIYIQDPNHLATIQRDFNNIKNSRLQSRHRLNFAIHEKSADGNKYYSVVDHEIAKQHSDVLVHMETLHPKPTKWISALLWRNKGTVFTNGTGVGYVRRSYAVRQSPSKFWKEPLSLK